MHQQSMGWGRTHEARAQPGVGAHRAYLFPRALLGSDARTDAAAGFTDVPGTMTVAEPRSSVSPLSWSAGRGASKPFIVLAVQLVAVPAGAESRHGCQDRDF